MKKIALLSLFLWSLLLIASPKANFEQNTITYEQESYLAYKGLDSVPYPIRKRRSGIGTNDEISGGGEENGAAEIKQINKTGQNWYFGIKAGLDFSTDPPTPISGSAMKTFEGCASISDDKGNLLFYTEGRTLWDATNTIRVEGLKGHNSSSQSALIVPNPSNEKEYYVFTIDGASSDREPSNHFDGILLNIDTWSAIPISELMPMPDVFGYSPAEKLTAVPHKSCKAYWIVTIIQEGEQGDYSGSGIFRIFKVDSNGITHHSDTPMHRTLNDLGYMKTSHDQQRIALADGFNKKVYVYTFDNELGKVDIASGISINSTDLAYGVEFSPDNKLLYYGSIEFDGRVFQVDLSDPTLKSTLVATIANSGQGYAIGALQLGMDQKIYISRYGANNLAAILKPNIKGLGCTVAESYVDLPFRAQGQLGLPYLLPKPISSKEECKGDEELQVDAQGTEKFDHEARRE